MADEYGDVTFYSHVDFRGPVTGLPVQPEPPPIVEEFPAGVFTMNADTQVLFLAAGAEVNLPAGLENGQRLDVVLTEDPTSACVIQTGGSPPTFKTNGDGLIAHYSLVLYWSMTAGAWLPTATMQWDF